MTYQGQETYTPYIVKHFNNMTICFSCRWDVLIWHNSESCQAKFRKQGHHKEVNCNNARAYKNTGHAVSMKCARRT